MSDRVRIAAIVAAALVTFAALLAGCSGDDGSWPDSAEFSQLPSGQERFSVHATNLSRWKVIVDHRTGAQYIANTNGRAICALVSQDGTPLLVDEAGE